MTPLCALAQTRDLPTCQKQSISPSSTYPLPPPALFPSNQKSENTFLNVWSRISPRTGHTYQQDYVWSQVMNFYLTIMILPVILSFTKASVAFTISFAQKSSNVAGSL